MTDGLKLTIPGDELRALLDKRIRSHQRRAEWWRTEETRQPDDQTEDKPLLPEEMCANEAEEHEWRVEVLEFVRDHIDTNEVYRLGADDLYFGELLPEKPASLEQTEYEERTGVAFQLERLTKKAGELASAIADSDR